MPKIPGILFETPSLDVEIWSKLYMHSLLGKSVQPRANQSSSCKDYRPRTHNNVRVMQFLQSCPIYVQHDEFWHFFVLWPKSFRGPSFRSQLVRYAMKTGLVWLCLRGGFQYAHLIELCWTSHSLEHPSIDLQSQSQFLSCYLNLPNQNSANVGLINPYLFESFPQSCNSNAAHAIPKRNPVSKYIYSHWNYLKHTYVCIYIYMYTYKDDHIVFPAFFLFPNV